MMDETAPRRWRERHTHVLDLQENRGSGVLSGPGRLILYFLDEDGERWGRRAVSAIGRRISIGQALHFLMRIG